MDVRAATPADAEAIARVHTCSWHVAYADVFPPERLAAWRSDAEQLRSSISQPAPRSAAVVAADGARVVGFSTCGVSRDEGGIGELYAIYVDPDAWGTGAGRALLERAEQSLRENGFPEATLWVLEDNPRARRFYENARWALDGARQDERFLETDVREVRYRKRF